MAAERSSSLAGGAAGSRRAIPAGMAAGAMAAIAASLVQLPLHSPTDVVFNSLTVTVGSLIAGLLAGALWAAARKSAFRRRLYYAVWLALFGVVAGAAAVGDTQLDRTLSFVVPLAAIVMASTGIGTPVLAGSGRIGYLVASIAVAAAVGVGAGLATQGDAESGRLELPPRAHEAMPDNDAGMEEAGLLAVFDGCRQVRALVV